MYTQIEEQFWNRLDRRSDDECWLWQAGVTGSGYGATTIAGKFRSAHNVSYVLHKGAVPPGHVIDHICRNRLCANPAHLRAVTAKQNQENTHPRGCGWSGVRGVVWDKNVGKWRAQAKHHGKLVLAGYSHSVDEAGEMVRQLRLDLFTHNEMDRETEHV